MIQETQDRPGEVYEPTVDQMWEMAARWVYLSPVTTGLELETWVSSSPDAPPSFPCQAYSVCEPGAARNGTYYRLAFRQKQVRRSWKGRARLVES